MLGSIYIGLSGMTAYSKGLDAISNNVANLNTPGFKFSVPMFTDALFGNGAGLITSDSTNGSGVNVTTDRVSFRQGELRDTANSLDAGLDGNGFFVLEQDGEYLFTRAGQFDIDDNGDLIERTTKARVLVRTDENPATYLNIAGLRAEPPKATTTTQIIGSLARTGALTFDLTSFGVYDTAGGLNMLKGKLARSETDPLRWGVEMLDADNNVLGRGELRFNADGTPAEGFNSVVAHVQPKGNLPAFDVVVKFGEPGSFTGVTSVPNGTQSQLNLQKQDGLAIGTLTQTSFDAKGQVTLTYSNGVTKKPATLVLAQLDGVEGLRPLGGGLYIAASKLQPKFAAAETEGLGTVVSKKLELSNVELTEQFTDLIIIQRGYQASSQMASVANEMLQQLLAMGERR